MAALSSSPLPPVDLSKLPPMYLLPGHLTDDKQQELKELLRSCKSNLAETASNALLFITDCQTSKRAEFELRRQGVNATPADPSVGPEESSQPIHVVNLAWLTESVRNGEIKDIKAYSILTSTAVDKDGQTKKRKIEGEGIPTDTSDNPLSKKLCGGSLTGDEQHDIASLFLVTKKSRPIVRRSTSSFEAGEHLKKNKKNLPEWISAKNTYSCCRSTPMNCPNDLFVGQLKTIRHSRMIIQDAIGIRAYSTAIAAIKAYPMELRAANEIQLLPGCGSKIARLFHEWKHSDNDPNKRIISAVKELNESGSYQTLLLFESIWGVGPDYAKKLYYTYRFRSLNDIIRHHWDKLSRVQKIGVKYYNEILAPIPRNVVEGIASLITKYARVLVPGVESMLVGGYRLGTRECGDVNLLLSHKHESATGPGFLVDLLRQIENAGFISHTLSVNTSNLTKIDAHHPQTVFDGLDKALLLWKTIGKEPHRRVSIIVAPSVCAGTALLGWSGGTTFERDLRLWCQKKGWKFSSEGVWTRHGLGERVKGTFGWLEREEWADVERRVMEAIGIGWRDPTERCTG